MEYVYNCNNMKLESSGILISLRPFGERDCVAHIFTSGYGVMCGMMRGAMVAKKNRPLVGQVGVASWNARLDSQLGTFHWEPEKNLAAGVMLSRGGLGFLNSAFGLILSLLPEREQYKNLYDQTLNMLDNLCLDAATELYQNWEIALLREMGYALDLRSCSGCGTHDDLQYLSPRTGRAVCAKCAAPYVDKLYHLPLDLNVLRHFINRACDAQGVELPLARKIL